MNRLRSLFAGAFCLAQLFQIGCGANQTESTPVPGESRAVPQVAAAAPKWLSKAEFDALNNSQDSKATIDGMDAFVLMASNVDAAERPGRVAQVATMAKMMLHSLYYDVDFSVGLHPSQDPKLFAALSLFKSRAGLPASNVFSMSDLEQLQSFYGVATQLAAGITPLESKTFGGDGDYVYAKGTWVIKGEKIAWPINSAQIDCWRSFGNCIVADAHITPPSSNSGGPYISVDTAYWDITSWSPTRVVAEKSALCRRTVLTVDLGTKQAFQITTDVAGSDSTCTTLGKLETPRVTTLEDGFEVGRAVADENRKNLERVSNVPWSKLKERFSPSSVQNKSK